MNEQINWIPISERMPDKPGMYKIKTSTGTIAEAPYVRSFAGKLQWLVPGTITVTHWAEKT